MHHAESWQSGGDGASEMAPYPLTESLVKASCAFAAAEHRSMGLG